MLARVFCRMANKAIHFRGRPIHFRGMRYCIRCRKLRKASDFAHAHMVCARCHGEMGREPEALIKMKNTNALTIAKSVVRLSESAKKEGGTLKMSEVSAHLKEHFGIEGKEGGALFAELLSQDFFRVRGTSLRDIKKTIQETGALPEEEYKPVNEIILKEYYRMMLSAIDRGDADDAGDIDSLSEEEIANAVWVYGQQVLKRDDQYAMQFITDLLLDNDELCAAVVTRLAQHVDIVEILMADASSELDAEEAPCEP